MTKNWTIQEFQEAEGIISSFEIHVFKMAEKLKNELPFMAYIGPSDVSLHIASNDEVYATFYVGDSFEPPNRVLQFPFELMNVPLEKLSDTVDVVHPAKGKFFKLVKKESK